MSKEVGAATLPLLGQRRLRPSEQEGLLFVMYGYGRAGIPATPSPGAQALQGFAQVAQLRGWSPPEALLAAGTS